MSAARRAGLTGGLPTGLAGFGAAQSSVVAPDPACSACGGDAVRALGLHQSKQDRTVRQGQYLAQLYSTLASSRRSRAAISLLWSR